MLQPSSQQVTWTCICSAFTWTLLLILSFQMKEKKLIYHFSVAITFLFIVQDSILIDFFQNFSWIFCSPLFLFFLNFCNCYVYFGNVFTKEGKSPRHKFFLSWLACCLLYRYVSGGFFCLFLIAFPIFVSFVLGKLSQFQHWQHWTVCH